MRRYGLYQWPQLRCEALLSSIPLVEEDNEVIGAISSIILQDVEVYSCSNEVVDRNSWLAKRLLSAEELRIAKEKRRRKSGTPIADRIPRDTRIQLENLVTTRSGKADPIETDR